MISHDKLAEERKRLVIMRAANGSRVVFSWADKKMGHAERLSKEERSTIAKNAAVQRWKAHPISAAWQRPDISDDADIIDVQTLDGEYFSAAPLDGSIEGLPIAEFGSADRPLRIGEDIE